MKAIGRKIYQVIEQDPEVLRSDVEVQWRQLIVETVISFHSLPPATMIIDGLDECGSTDDQRKILELVASCGPYFPISFLIASRPEPHIINSFDTEPLSLICQVVIDLVAYKDDQEMEMFVQASFSRIFTEHYDLLKSYSVDGVWPSDDIVDLITAKADGQFIYPVTLFKYIGEVYADPQERLMLCLEQNLEVLSPLDALYTQILQSSHEPDNTTIQDFLFLLFPAEDREAPTLQILSLILDLDTAEIRSYLRKLHSVVDIPEDDYNEIRIHHQSFIDFLLDSDRCSAYQINQRDSAIRIINGCLSALKKYPGSAGEVMPLLQTWWSCCRILSHEDVGPRLVSRMERLDFEGVLRVFPGNRGIEFIGSCYKDFIGTCQSWVSAGSSKESGTTEYWRNSSLLAKFKPDILVVAKEAQELSKQFKEFHKKLNDTFAYTCPISWNGLLILAQAELNHESSVLVTKRWKIGHITDNFVYSTLLLFCDENLVQKLYVALYYLWYQQHNEISRAKEDLMYLSTWSRCWAEHW
ncbi:hypothetical protein AX16_001335 [Volvariella volvacea WC 439]|nr:hypothetical protein AX16_001335 [Volvariella volvacea WC 439]